MQTKKNDNKYDQTESNQTANNEQTESIVKWDPQASASSTDYLLRKGAYFMNQVRTCIT